MTILHLSFSVPVPLRALVSITETTLAESVPLGPFIYSLPSSEPVSSVAEINSSTATSKYPAKILSFAIFGLLLPDFQSEKVDFGIPVSFATL